MSFDPAALPNDVDALKSIIGDMVRDAVAARTEIEKLRFQLARFKRTQFGQSSEKVERTVEQLELAIETLARSTISENALGGRKPSGTCAIAFVNASPPTIAAMHAHTGNAQRICHFAILPLRARRQPIYRTCSGTDGCSMEAQLHHGT